MKRFFLYRVIYFILFYVPVYSHAEWYEQRSDVTFGGSITATPCFISNESIYQRIDFGQISTSSLIPSFSAKRMIEIKLLGCSLAAEKDMQKKILIKQEAVKKLLSSVNRVNKTHNYGLFLVKRLVLHYNF